MRRIRGDITDSKCVFLKRQRGTNYRSGEKKKLSTIITVISSVVDPTLYEGNSPNRSRRLTGILEELSRSGPLGSGLDSKSESKHELVLNPN